jgi:hypothetical protein
MSLVRLKRNFEGEAKDSLLANLGAGQYGSVISIFTTIKPWVLSILTIELLLANETW